MLFYRPRGVFKIFRNPVLSRVIVFGINHLHLDVTNKMLQIMLPLRNLPSAFRSIYLGGWCLLKWQKGKNGFARFDHFSEVIVSLQPFSVHHKSEFRV